MKKNILLIRPNCTNNKKDTYITFALGIGYIASVLEKNNYNVKVIDLTLEDVYMNDIYDRINKFKPDIIGITALSNSYPQVKDLALFLKGCFNIPIILGGHLAHHSYEVVLKNTEVDICVMGEGEETIIDLLDNMDTYTLENVKGIAFKKGLNVFVTEPRDLIQDLNSIPFPAYHLFDMEKYLEFNDIYLSKQHIVKKKIHKRMSIEAGRGCPFNCNFCSKMFRKVRKRSVSSITAEMRYLHGCYGVDVFWFQDELLFSNKKYMYEFCDNIKDMKIGWYGNARIDSVDRDVIQKAKDNKCLLIAYGVETGSRKILKNMNKKITPEKIIDILKMTMEVGLPLDMGLILGYPEEDKNTIQETVDVLNEVGFPGLRFRYITPYPGSKLYDDCIKKGLIPNEEDYLISLGDGSGVTRFRFNFTKLTDNELHHILGKTVNKVFVNYIIYLLKHPTKLLNCIFKKDFMNPLYILYSRWTNPTDYDKACKNEIKDS